MSYAIDLINATHDLGEREGYGFEDSMLSDEVAFCIERMLGEDAKVEGPDDFMVWCFVGFVDPGCDYYQDFVGSGWYGNSLGTVHGNPEDTNDPGWYETAYDFYELVAQTVIHNCDCVYEDQWDVHYFGDDEEPKL